MCTVSQNRPGALGQGGRSSPAGSGHGAFSGRDFRLAGFVLVKNLLLFIAVSGTGTDGAVLGVIYRTAGGLIMAAILAGTVYIFYVMLVWQKAYNLFNVSFKNKYVLDTIRQLPGFSELRYNSQGGFTRQELQRFNLLPSCMITYYKASDELRGILDGTRFRASSVSVGKRASGRRSLPDIVFEGQIIGFETFDSQKSSSGYIQVMDWKLRDDMAKKAGSLPIQTESEAFNARFAVFAEEEHNAFYILTPQILERIIAFADTAGDAVYLVFSQSELYVACRQARSILLEAAHVKKEAQ